MALAIDTTSLALHGIPDIQTYLDERAGHTRRFQLYRVCVHATIVHATSTIMRLSKASGRLVKQEALEWEADQDEDLDELEVFHHLSYQAKTSPMFTEALSQTERIDATATTLVTSCSVQSPSLPVSAHGRPFSSFHRYSLRESSLSVFNEHLARECCTTQEVMTTAPKSHRIWWSYLGSALKIVGARSVGNEAAVVWHLQYDFVDLLKPRILPTSRPGKRRRTTLNPFHQVSSAPLQHSSPGSYHPPEAKRFKGVRYRRDRRTWVAEMKPPKYRNKVSFGEFKSQAQAARVVDAAFHFYGKTHLLNFPDTPHILSRSRPTPAGFNEARPEDKLSFVKEQAKWLASMASTLPSPPPSVPFQTPDSSSGDCSAGTLGLRSFSDISSALRCADADGANDDISLPQPSLHPEAMAGLIDSNLVVADAAGAIIDTLEERQGIFHWNLEDAFADPCLSPRWSPSSSSVQIADGWDGAEDSSASALSNFVNPSQPCEGQRTWVDDLVMSPPAAMIPMPPSPSDFQRDAAHALLEEQESFGGEWLSGRSVHIVYSLRLSESRD